MMLRLLVLACVASILLIAPETESFENSTQRTLKIGKFVLAKTRNVVFPGNQDHARLTPPSASLFLHLLKHKLSHQKIEKVSTTPASTDCICVPYYLCDDNRTIITDGSGVIDVRYRRCTGDLEVCCYLPNSTASMAPIITPTPTTPTTPPTTPTTPTTPPTTPTTPPTTPTTPTTPPTTPTTPTTPPTTPTTPTTPPTTPTTPPTTPTTPPTTPTTPPLPIPTSPPVIFPTAPPTLQPTVLPTGPPGLNCICVLSWQCNPNDVVGVSGEGVINPRQQVGLCPSADQVCCRANSGSIQIPTTPPTALPPIISTVSPGQSQICVICGNTIQCLPGFIIPGDTGLVDPRLSSQRSICGATNFCCQAGNSVDGSAILNSLGALKNPDTPQACYCVKTWWCTEGNAVNVDGIGVIDPRFTACAAADEICCRPAGVDVQAVRDAASKEGAYIVNVMPGPPMPSLDACGVQNKTYAPAQPFTADSGQTYFAEFPWMVALLVEQTNGQYLFQCGGSLINKRAILTAAHCMTNRANGKLVARFGQWDLETSQQPVPFQEVSVQTIVSHPLYYSGGLFHDIAILILEKPINYSVNVMPICLPSQGMSFAAGTRCYGTGWGRNSFDGIYQAQLRKVELPIVDRSDCQTRLRTTRLGPYFQLHGSFICAGGEASRDTCRGDGGGPLACATATGQFVQAGIVSWGIGCGASNVPAVYTSVPQHRQWIDQQLATYGV